MSHNNNDNIIKEGAIFIADAHCNAARREFVTFLQKIDDQTIQTSQLFLMGDMFDLLSGETIYVQKQNKESIQLLNSIAQKIEVFYFEGNHDFHLKKLFPQIKVYTIASQPACYRFKDQNIALSHGDIYANFGYKLYTKCIRSVSVLKILNYLDHQTDFSISKKILNSQSKKNLCTKIAHFQEVIKEKLRFYDIPSKKLDLICEGHYHQDKAFDFEDVKYINFSSFACDQCYFRIKFNDTVTFQKESLRG